MNLNGVSGVPWPAVHVPYPTVEEVSYRTPGGMKTFQFPLTLHNYDIYFLSMQVMQIVLYSCCEYPIVSAVDICSLCYNKLYKGPPQNILKDR